MRRTYNGIISLALSIEVVVVLVDPALSGLKDFGQLICNAAIVLNVKERIVIQHLDGLGDGRSGTMDKILDKVHLWSVQVT